jgi:hypothetical protein
MSVSLSVHVRRLRAKPTVFCPLPRTAKRLPVVSKPSQSGQWWTERP